MKVFKFGGASVKSAKAITNLKQIVEAEEEKLIIVISALGKTTNKLEVLCESFINSSPEIHSQFEIIKKEHQTIIDELFEKDHIVFSKLNEQLQMLEKYITKPYTLDYEYNYDQIVHFGEILSTIIVSEYLNNTSIKNTWVDIRKAFKTDSNFKEANIDFSKTNELVKRTFNFEKEKLYITQGFIASNDKGEPVTLGREGSDYSAAILANLLNAESLTIWKDVPGILNADPKFFSDTVKINELSYLEAIELAYSGAQVIHPKTIKPLYNKKIPLFVKSCVEPEGKGTVIKTIESPEIEVPICIVKKNQLLLTLKPKDYSFVLEDCISKLFGIFFQNNIKVNLIQTSAISFSISIDNEKRKLVGLLDEFKEGYTLLYNENVELYTVRHYTKEYLAKLLSGKTIYLEQKAEAL